VRSHFAFRRASIDPGNGLELIHPANLSTKMSSTFITTRRQWTITQVARRRCALVLPSMHSAAYLCSKGSTLYLYHLLPTALQCPLCSRKCGRGKAHAICQQTRWTSQIQFLDFPSQPRHRRPLSARTCHFLPHRLGLPLPSWRVQ
jgi:hypothetical protein